MPGSVTRLRPRIGSLENALAAFRAARLEACISELHGLDSVSAATLKGRALLRVGEPEKALAALELVAAYECRDQGEIALLKAVALARVGRAEQSADAFVDARVFGVSSADPALQAEVEFYLGLSAFGEGNLHETRVACRRGLEIASAAHDSASASGGLVPLPHVVSRTQELLGIVEAADGRYGEFFVEARRALATLEASPIRDVYQEGFAIKNLAILARDFDLRDEARTIAERASALPWTDEIARPRFAATEALGWSAALHGDSVGALRWFREAASCATLLPERVQASVSKATLVRELGCEPLAFEELEFALSLASSCDWESAAGDSRVVLLPLAQAVAALSPSRARELLERYCGIRNGMDLTFASRIEARVRAEEAFTHGLVLRAERRLAASTERLKVAFDLWESIGYEWRASRAALELAELDAGEIFRTAVRRELTLRPQSPFAGRARLVA